MLLQPSLHKVMKNAILLFALSFSGLFSVGAATPLEKGQIGSASINAAIDSVVTVGTAAPVNAVAATLATSLTGANNDLTYTAVTKGTIGNTITIAYVNPGVETATETIAVVGKAITVTLRSVSSVLSTAAQVETAIEASAAASALVTVANTAANDGSGAVIALTATALANGVNGTLGNAKELRYYGGYLYFTPTAMTTSTATWVKSAQWTAP